MTNVSIPAPVATRSRPAPQRDFNNDSDAALTLLQTLGELALTHAAAQTIAQGALEENHDGK